MIVDHGPDGRQDERGPDELRVAARLEGAEAGEGDEQGGGARGEREDEDPARVPEQGRGGEADEEQAAADDGGVPPEAERHGEPLPVFGGGPEAAEMQVGIERAEQDVGDVERAERPLLEHG